mgnify:CR=1 FL=1
MKRYSQVGIGIDDKCAMEFIDDKYRVLATNSSAKAYRIYRQGRNVKIEEIKKSKEFAPLDLLYKKTR